MINMRFLHIVRARLPVRFQRRPVGTQGQQDQARETEVSLGLMAQAAAAGPDMAPEQQIFLSQSEHGMRERLGVLLGIPHRSLAQEREKLAIEGWLGRTNHPEIPDSSSPIRGLLGPVTALAPWKLWAAGGLAALALGGWGVAIVQSNLKERVEDQRDEARADLAQSERNLVAAREVNDRLAQAVRDADEQSRLTAANLEAERRRSAALRARQMERAREAQDVLARNQPPAWDDRLRDLAPGADRDPAADSDPAGLPR